jgi:F-type H+-transporting ATPase subunit b
MKYSKLNTPLKVLVFLIALSVPAIALASSEGGAGGHGASLKAQGFYLINFIVFLWLLKVAIWDKLQEAMASRSDAIKESIEVGQLAAQEAMIREDEAKARLETMPQEVGKLEQSFKTQGQNLANTIADRTKVEEEKIRASAKAASEGETQANARIMTKELAKLTLDKAEDIIRRNKGRLDQEALFAGFVNNLKTEAEANSGTQN